MAITLAMAPGTCIILEIPTALGSGGTWSLYDTEAGTLTDYESNIRKKMYCHGNKIGTQKITYSTTTDFCVLNVVVMLPHDHSDINKGGPAFGTYKS